MSYRIMTSFAEGLAITSETPEDMQIASGSESSPYMRQLKFTQLTSGLRGALERLRGDGTQLSELNGTILGTDGFAGIPKLSFFIKCLAEKAFLQHRLEIDGELFIDLRPMTGECRFDPLRVVANQAYLLSRFAYLRRGDGDKMILASPKSSGLATLHNLAALTAFYHLTKPCTSAGLAEAIESMEEESARGFMAFLASTGALEPVDENGETRDDTHPALAQWSFQDLVFHAKSRMGRHDQPFGATYRHATRFETLPISKPPMSDELIPLYKPDMDRLMREEVPFSAIQNNRQSVREYGKTPITLQQLGEFLYRTARIKHSNKEAKVSWRPSPSGGALHELEIYPVVQNCEGLLFGLYHYDPAGHQLSRVTSAAEQEVKQLLGFGELAGVLKEPAQVLLIIAARFQRNQIKYDSVPYAITLKNVGALYTTMYLVAGAMGLAPCALGGGNADLFSRTAGLDYYAETSVGEFLLGSRPATPPKSYRKPPGMPDRPALADKQGHQ